ncbi:hypothetical protein EVAR_41203_1 [Eumeta japonica]|uniref:Uncharacterized protein n=1 Tax=Eumeta variegata TaxID=151549 RepID=A0A4C1WPE6_EUMVA|nr:hypothetical protein EVAR_41203_1 [Eumeta japonica]
MMVTLQLLYDIVQDAVQIERRKWFSVDTSAGGVRGARAALLGEKKEERTLPSTTEALSVETLIWENGTSFPFTAQ